MELTNSQQAVVDHVRKVCEEVAAEKLGTIVDLSDPNVRGPYFSQIRGAGNDVLQQARLDGVEGFSVATVFTPSRSDDAAIDASDSDGTANSFEMGIRFGTVHTPDVEAITWRVSVAAILDMDGDGQ